MASFRLALAASLVLAGCGLAQDCKGHENVILCDGNTLRACWQSSDDDIAMPAWYWHDTTCGACIEKDGQAACVHAPLTPCTGP